jgi:uncharacterized protein
MALELTLEQARRLAVMGSVLSAPRPRSILEVVDHLGSLQIDPTSAVARAEHLVLWSRLGSYDVRELDRLLWQERRLFEYRAFIVPTSDFAIHRAVMRRYPRGGYGRARYIREWLAANASFRRYVLRELRRRGPLRTRDLEDRAVEGWRTGGWNDDGRSVSMMLEVLAHRGEIAIAGRAGNERLWDLAERWHPLQDGRQPPREIARRLLETQLRWCGLARPDAFGLAFDGPPPGRAQALRELVREGVAVPLTVKGLAGEWFGHGELLERRFRPRTTLLCPFDKLIAHRGFTKELFGFRFRLEIYVPKAKREYGYYVLPILHGDRLIGRIDPLFDRKSGVLRVNAVYAEPDAPADAWPQVRAAIDDLAAWVGAEEVTLPRLPRVWR